MKKHRVNLTLPEDLLHKLRARIPKRKLSQYIAEAALSRLEHEERSTLRERLEEQYLARKEEDLRLAEEFFAAEEDAPDSPRRIRD